MSTELPQDLEKGSKAYQFDRIVQCNIGNPQVVFLFFVVSVLIFQYLGQKAITFFRQVSAITVSLTSSSVRFCR
jgi:hypothetical protein